MSQAQTITRAPENGRASEFSKNKEIPAGMMTDVLAKEPPANDAPARGPYEGDALKADSEKGLVKLSGV